MEVGTCNKGRSMKKSQKVAAVLLAAGQSRRFGKGPPKQYREIDGRPILSHVLKKFLDCRIFSEIIIVVDKGWIAQAPKLITASLPDILDLKIVYVKGGSSRSQSSYNALKSLRGSDVEFVLFHDVARPFIEKDVIKKVVHAAKKHGNAIAGVKAIESVAVVQNTKVTKAFPSEDLFQMQTPECFRFETIAEAYEKFSQDKKYFRTATNLHLLLRLKKEIIMVRHPERNLKLTFPSDLKIARIFLSEKYD